MAALLFTALLATSSASADCNCTITIHADGVWNCLPATCSDAVSVDLYTVNATVLDLANVVRVWGDFRILASRHITDVIAPKLTSVFGKFSIEQNVELVTVEFPLLRDAVGYFKIQANSVLVSARFPVLTESPYLEISGNPVLEKVAFNDLAMVPNILITNNKVMSSVLLPALRTVESISIEADAEIDLSNLSNATEVEFTLNGQLRVDSLRDAETLNVNVGEGAKPVVFPSLTHVSEVDCEGRTAKSAAEFSFPKLTSWDVSGSFSSVKSVSLPALTTSVSLQIEDSPDLVSLEFPALTTAKEDFSISGNAKLQMVSFPKLTKAANLEFWTNPELATLRFPELGQVQSLTVKGYNYLTEFLVPKLKTADFIGFGISSLAEEHDVAQVTPKKLKTHADDVILSLPSLTNVTTLSFKSDLSFTAVSVPLLTRIPNLNFQLNSVVKISLPALTTAPTQINLYRNSQLTSLEIPLLKSVGKFSLSYSDELTGLNFQSLTTAKGIYINDNYGLKTISFPVLASASVDINSNIMLKTVDLKSLHTSASVHVADLRVYDGVAGCVNLDCLNFNKDTKPYFSVYWCRRQNSTTPDCSKGAHWDCTCPM